MSEYSLKQNQNGIAFLKASYKNKQPFFFKPITQPKLTVNRPNDIYEQEADAVADKVMRMPDPRTNNNFFCKQGVSSIQRKCAHCEEEGKQIQRKGADNYKTNTDVSTENYISTLNGSGRPITRSERSFFEPRMGYDFSRVRLHTGNVAAKSAQSINALAYTTGNNIVFGANQFSSESDDGKKLLAHELTHVVQQKKGNGISQIQRMAACPGHLNDGEPTPVGWKDYFGASGVFHCGFRTILEDRMPTPSDPMNECVYDHSGTLVDENHPYSGCRGTPDQYDSRTSPVRHATIDSGGIVRAGAPALATSALHAIASPFEAAYNWMDRGIRNLYGVP